MYARRESEVERKHITELFVKCSASLTLLVFSALSRKLRDMRGPLSTGTCVSQEPIISISKPALRNTCYFTFYEFPFSQESNVVTTQSTCKTDMRDSVYHALNRTQLYNLEHSPTKLSKVDPTNR